MTNAIPDNYELIRGLKRGEVFAFDEIFKKYNRKIYSISLSYLKNKEDAEGVVQEVFLNLWRKRTSLIEKYNFDSYLFTITYNTIRKRFRKISIDKKYTEEYSKTIIPEDDSTRADIEYKNLLETVKIAIDHLPERQKTVYHLNVNEGLNSEEISKKLGISRRTVENHLHRARMYLKKTLSDNRFISLLFIWLFI